MGARGSASAPPACWVGAPPQRLGETPVFRQVVDDPGSPRIGSASADVTVVVFTDYQCPVCRRTDAALGRLLAQDPRSAVIYKDWPILGEASRAAAQVALAAARQGRYAEVDAALMASRGALSADRVRGAAVSAGVDWSRLAADRRRECAQIEAQLGRHALQAFALGLEGTPAYLVGRQLVRGGLDDGALRRLMKVARADRSRRG
ncbi:MAG: disulfide bond formation protein DsbA [Phenylobacterium zucineum]|nr:MAG: disulfide bond formation protein DsbA [Phenylobacterium zucineum]